VIPWILLPLQYLVALPEAPTRVLLQYFVQCLDDFGVLLKSLFVLSVIGCPG